MLVLTREPGQDILLYLPGNPEPLVLRYVQLDGMKVRLGIIAPKDVAIFRRELVDKAARNGEELRMPHG